MTDLLIKLFIPDAKNFNDPKVRKKFGTLSGVVGIICNTILFLAKLFVGIVTSSIAVTADAFNNLSDAGASIVTLACFKIAGAPADKEHPFGHGRVEYISGLIVSVAIILTGLSFVKSSIEKIISPEPISFSKISLFILVLSLLVKLWMGLFNRKLGDMANSSAMKATSFDSLADAIATGAVILSMLVSYFTGISVDAYAGILVAVFILLTGVQMIKETLNPLLGQAPDPELVKDINKTILSYKDIIGIHELMVHNYGPGRSVISLHAEMPANVDIFELHDTIDAAEKELKEKFNCQAVIHMDPIVTDDERVNRLRKEVEEIVKMINLEAKVYDFRVVPGSRSSTLVFELSVPFELNKPEDEIIKVTKEEIEKLGKPYKCIINVNRENCIADDSGEK